jgi:hydrogenase maturation protease
VEKRLALTSASPTSHEITVTEACVGGIRLMELLVGYERAILIDAFTGDEMAPPGTVRRMTLDDLRRLSPTQHTASAHDTTLINALDTGRALQVPLPEEVTIYAINVANVLDFAEEMTPAVAAAVPEVVTAVLQDLSNHTKKQKGNGYTDGTD